MIRVLALSLSLCLLARPALADTVTVFAAASLGPALEEAAALWEDETGHDVTVAAAGSSVLARQIAQGAPADLYVSASPDWMDWTEGQGVIDVESRRVLMTNALVLVGHGGLRIAPVPMSPEFDIPARLGEEGRLAMALVDAVPAGLYGRQALTWLGQWEALAPRVAQADNVRAALALVALGEAPLGVVYATDARAEPRVHVAGTFPPESHDPIVYPGAVIAGADSPEAAGALLDWLAGPAAQAVFARHGFGPPG
ncbi:Molybdate-binding periplasmic protein precursor [Roseivivax jejudonensis]|uniref:Molybdate-binding periplasmic protein n=1 Tax=Roseivivax jejudonensis TaxID=1529041 RepID=A0A1X6ZI89_9RHOB|nr:molybdate ABC transporter substrate-binding protein [Roseivivax jejudonensis]SLN52503.1 Molybdate-binding periplasmic protein precursor [Roseivivax jejudonensis]